MRRHKKQMGLLKKIYLGKHQGIHAIDILIFATQQRFHRCNTNDNITVISVDALYVDIRYCLFISGHFYLL